MPTMPSAFRVCLLLLAAACSRTAAQDRQVPLAPEPAPATTLRITVTLVQVDAVVTDSKGRRVAGLRPEDFELRQDGQPQKLTLFTYIPEPPPPPRAPQPKSKREDQAPIGPPAPITPGQVKRAVALVVDDLGLSFENLVRVRDALRTYVERRMQPGDLTAIVRTGGGVAFLEQFTTDKRVLLEAIDLLKWRFSGRCCLLPIDPVSHGAASPDAPRGAPQALDYSISLSALGSLGAMREVIRGMRPFPGRKALVLLSESMRLDARVTAAIDDLTDLANRSAVSLYTVDPAGLRVNFPAAADDIESSDAGTMLETLSATLGGGVAGGQDGLRYLAKRTGGISFFNNNDIPDCIRRAIDDQLGYYLIGYSPQEGTFDPDPRKAKFHRISLSVRRPGLAVRWKTGFNGVPDTLVDAGLDSGPKTREQQLMEAMASPFSATGLKVRLTSMFRHTREFGPVVRSMLHFDANGLSFRQDAEGAWTATVDTLTAAYRGVRQTVIQGQRRHTIRLPEETYRQGLKEGFVYLMDTPMKEPGAFLLRAVVRDAESQRIGSASQVVQVPETRKDRFALSGVTIKLVPPEMMKTLKQVPAEARAGNAEPWSEGGPAIRRYRPGQSILYSYVVINPKVKGPAKLPSLTSYVRVFRNGAPIYVSEPRPLLEEGRIDASHYAGAGALHLGPRLPPGEYLVQVVVTDRYARKKQSQVAQWGDFEVVAPVRP